MTDMPKETISMSTQPLDKLKSSCLNFPSYWRKTSR